jgi:hypothetical protein
MEHERKLLIKRRMLEQEAHQKFDELEIIFQRMYETDEKIEEQRQKQVVKNNVQNGNG